MAKWADLRDRVLRALNDNDRLDLTSVKWTDVDMLDYVSSALAAISPHTAQQKVYEVKFEEKGRKLLLPDDFIDLGPVFLITTYEQRLMDKLVLEQGQVLPNSNLSSDEIRFYVWPEGTLNFTGDIDAGASVRLFYWGYWDVPQQESDIVRIPKWMEEPLYWYMLSQAVTKPGFKAAELGQYKSRIDAGGPLDNPMLEFGKYCNERYERHISARPTQDRTRWESE